MRIRRRGWHATPSQAEKATTQAGKAAPVVAIAGVNSSLATFNALGNAKSAIILPKDGANGSPWTTHTTHTTGAYQDRC